MCNWPFDGLCSILKQRTEMNHHHHHHNVQKKLLCTDSAKAKFVKDIHKHQQNSVFSIVTGPVKYINWKVKEEDVDNDNSLN